VKRFPKQFYASEFKEEAVKLVVAGWLAVPSSFLGCGEKVSTY
jgi:hypothetical protein